MEAAAGKKKEAGEYDVVVRQLQFEMKAKVRCVICGFFILIILIMTNAPTGHSL